LANAEKPAMTAEQNKFIRTRTYQAGQWQDGETCVISEFAVSLTVNGELWLTFMCTPVHLEALAVGFLYNEGIIQRKEQIASVRVCPGNDNIDVWLTLSVEKPNVWARTSGCSGGETSVDEKNIRRDKIKTFNGLLLPATKVSDLVRQLVAAQELYRKSGGVHTSVLSDGDRMLVSAEDIGRHNTLDKLAGLCLLEDIHPDRLILLTTGRVSSEMIQKAGRMEAAVVISRTSPSSLSVQIANTLGITLIGYARAERFTIYTHPERILLLKEAEIIKREEA
jgi:FdhD protein